jgi:cysteine sulfinate desulfinase/cysteine desulfurase-like protein
VIRPLAKLATQGIKTTRIPVSPDSWVTSITEIEKAITSETRMLIMIHASNVTGVIQPINQYGLWLVNTTCYF